MKNQISIEYLSTFGWIILVVLVSILTLSYFGVFDISNQLPESCYFGEQLECENQFIDANGNLVLSLNSKFNVPVEITDIQVEGYNIDVNNCSSTLLSTAKRTNIICTLEPLTGNSLFEEERERFDVELIIKPVNIDETFIVRGNIFTDILSANLSTAFSCKDLAKTSDAQVCQKQYQCTGAGGTIISSEEYLGEGYCCTTSCVTDFCTNPSWGNGECCESCAVGSQITGSKFRLSCEDNYGSQAPLCCNQCAEGRGGGGPPIRNT